MKTGKKAEADNEDSKDKSDSGPHTIRIQGGGPFGMPMGGGPGGIIGEMMRGMM